MSNNQEVIWYNSVWFNLLMISISLCSCSFTAFYPIFSLKNNPCITSGQRKFLTIFGVATGALSTIVNFVLVLILIHFGIKYLKPFQ